jgi:hypothetical protein
MIRQKAGVEGADRPFSERLFAAQKMGFPRFQNIS